MINILRVEFFRLKKSKLFWIMLGVTAALPIISALATTLLLSLLDFIMGEGNMGSLVDIMRASNTTSSVLSGLGTVGYGATLFPLITAAVVLSKEFADGTMRNAILANKKRSELYFAYLIIALIVGVAYMLAFIVVTLVIIAPIFGFGGLSAGKIASAIFCSLALGICSILFAQSSVCMFLFGVRKQWATILFPLLIVMLVPDIFNTIIIILSTGMGINGQTISNTTISWLPFVNAQLYDAGAINGSYVGRIAMYYLLFAAIFNVIGYFTFDKADLK